MSGPGGSTVFIIAVISVSIGMLKFLPEHVEFLTSIKNTAQCYQTDFHAVLLAGHKTTQFGTHVLQTEIPMLLTNSMPIALPGFLHSE